MQKGKRKGRPFLDGQFFEFLTPVSGWNSYPDFPHDFTRRGASHRNEFLFTFRSVGYSVTEYLLSVSLGSVRQTREDLRLVSGGKGGPFRLHFGERHSEVFANELKRRRNGHFISPLRVNGKTGSYFVPGA